MCSDCTRLHEQLLLQSEEMYGLRRTISNLTKELKGERRKNHHLRKQKDEQHLRKGRKRGHYGLKG